MPRRIQDDEAARTSAAPGLQRFWELAQRLGNCGGPLKVLEMMTDRADFQPKNGGKA